MRLRMGSARKYYTRRTHTVQPGGGGGDIKISTLEKALLGLTAAFLLMTTGYFLGARSAADPYRVDTQYPAAAEIAAPSEAPPAAPEGQRSSSYSHASMLSCLHFSTQARTSAMCSSLR